jgi:hypothetical protein
LEEGYLARILVLRLCLVCLASATLDATLAARSYGSSWGWASRAGMLGMLVPLLMNVAGLLWPFLQLQTYEAHYQAFNKVRIPAGSTGLHSSSAWRQLLQVLGGQGTHTMPESAGQCSCLLLAGSMHPGHLLSPITHSP